jgi:Na+-transporting methylmalonyl-CoA/oxaloacetate decarboxylase gamma subunit
MEQVLEHVLERLSNPEVLFGLSVRFFGVFIVLTIVMLAIYLVGRVFVKLEESQNQTSSPAAPERPSPLEPVIPPRESTVPDEVAVAIALSLVPDEVGVAVALALAEAVKEGIPAPLLCAPPAGPAPREEPGSAWRLLGRQQALFRKTSLTRDVTPKGT